MWFPPIEAIRAGKPGTAFVLGVWHELFDPFTPDSFQPRLHNSSTLVSELVYVLERALAAKPWERHVHQIKQELRSVVLTEEDLLEILPNYRYLLECLIKSDDLNESLLYGRLLEQDRTEYDRAVLEYARSSAGHLPKGKQRMLKALRRLATVALHAGKEDDDVLEPVYANNLTTETGQVIEQLIEVVNRQEQTYECLLTVSGSQRDVQKVVRKVGFELTGRHHVPPDLVERSDERVGPCHFVSLQTKATSAREAAKACASRIRPAIDIYNLYCNTAALKLLDFVLLRKEGQEGFSTLLLGEQAFRRLHRRRHAGELTLKVLDEIPTQRFEARVLNALELHSLAHGSTAPRVQLVNLWSAAECLAGDDKAETVIRRVCSVFTPIIVWRRVEKIIRYISICLREFRDHGATEELGPGFPNSTDQFVDAWETMLAVSKPAGHPHICGLLRYAHEHPLLCFRAYALWQEYHEPGRLAKKLTESRQRVGWQLNRIYRARNLVVHDGIELATLGFLLDNLQYYFSITISRILHGLQLNPSWRVPEAVALWRAKNSYVQEMLDTRPSVLRLSDFFPGDRREDSPHIWQ